jgi:hypothetical protein
MGIYHAFRRQLIQDLELDQDRWYRAPERLLFTRISWEPLPSTRSARRQTQAANHPLGSSLLLLVRPRLPIVVISMTESAKRQEQIAMPC